MGSLIRLITIVYALAACCVTVSAQASSCQNSFVSSLYQCLSNRGLDKDNFLWVARGGKLGTEPRDSQAFTSRVCIEKAGLYMCVKTSLDNSLALPDAQCPQKQKTSLVTLFKDIFKAINTKCEDPCRATFTQSLAKCYRDENFSSVSFQLFNMTAPRDAILGTNSSEVERFCQVKSSIIQCLKVAALQCNDSPFLLKAYGLDIESLNETYTVLCNFTTVYMDSTECYGEPSVAMITCRNTLSTKLSELERQYQDLNTTESLYKSDLCRLRINQIQCEMNAISAWNDTTKCNDVIVGLRRQEECTLLPRDCRANTKNALNLLCKPSDFRLQERQLYKASDASVLGLSLALLFLSVFFSSFGF